LALLSPYTYEDTRSYRVPAGMAVTAGVSFFSPAILEKVSFNAYNENSCLTAAVERYKSRTGHYPERVLADQIYRTRDNRAYCKQYGIRLSGPKPGRPSPDAKADRKQTYQDNTDYIHRVICIRLEPFQAPETDIFASILAIFQKYGICWLGQLANGLISRH